MIEKFVDLVRLTHNERSVAVEVTISYGDLIEQTYGLLLRHMIVVFLLLKLFVNSLFRPWTELVPVLPTGNLFHQSVREECWLVKESLCLDFLLSGIVRRSHRFLI